MICDWLIAFVNASTESRMPCAVMLRNTIVSTSAPARSNAFAESYSQFVPGNTGMNTFGFATLFFAVYTVFASKRPVSIFFCSTPDSVGNTFSSVFVHAASASSIVTVTSP